MIEFSNDQDIALDQLSELYRANEWSAADKPGEHKLSIADSHYVVSAWEDGRLIGLGNAISDGHLVVYYPYLLVHPDRQRTGIGREIANRLMARYEGFHQQILVAVDEAIAFYESVGFERARGTTSMWAADFTP